MRKFVFVLLCCVCLLWAGLSAQAAAVTDGANSALYQALGKKSDKSLFSKRQVSVTGGVYHGRSSGVDPIWERGTIGAGVLGGESADRFAELEGDQRMNAFILDGAYHLETDLGTGLALQPYVGGGVGVALFDAPARETTAVHQQSSLVPMARVGAGLVYSMSKDIDVSFNYKAGFAADRNQETHFTSRNQDMIDLQMLDMGLKLRF